MGLSPLVGDGAPGCRLRIVDHHYSVFTSGRAFLKERGKLKLIVYFCALGMGFMLIEIAVIRSSISLSPIRSTVSPS